MTDAATTNEGRSHIERLEGMRDQVRMGGGSERIERQHAQGKLTAREWLDYLLDPGTFYEPGTPRAAGWSRADAPRNRGDGGRSGGGAGGRRAGGVIR